MSNATATPVTGLRLVPFNSAWINHDKIDIHAIYRRPRFVEDEYGEMQREHDANGLETWDLTGPLPVKQHTKWTQKGFEYITLADRQSLQTAARFGTVMSPEEGKDWRIFDQHQTGGPWNYKKYVSGQHATTTIEADELRNDVETYGSAAVEAIRRQTDKTFTLPSHLRNIQPGGKAATPASAKKMTVGKEGEKASA